MKLSPKYLTLILTGFLIALGSSLQAKSRFLVIDAEFSSHSQCNRRKLNRINMLHYSVQMKSKKLKNSIEINTFNCSGKIFTIKISDNEGTVLKATILAGNCIKHINLNELSAGIYTVTVSGQSFQKIEKIAIE